MNSSNLKGALQKITLPHKMVDKYKKNVLKKEIKKHQSVRRYKGQIVISCNKKQFNHYEGQTYSDFSPHHLASHGWKNNKAKGDFFTINATKGNPALEVEDEVVNFQQLGISQNISDILQGYGIDKPTDIQARCIPTLLNGNNVMCTAETDSTRIKLYLHYSDIRAMKGALSTFPLTDSTRIKFALAPLRLEPATALVGGECLAPKRSLEMIPNKGSGKTLSFLLPLVQKILKQKERGMFESAPNSPCGIVLVPSRELADQIHMVAVDLLSPLGMHCASLCGGRGTQRILKFKPQAQMDIVVATPGVLSKILTNGVYNLNRLSYIVLDEVDTLMDDSFNSKTLRIIKKLSQACGSLGSESSRGVSGGEGGEGGTEEEEVTGVQMVMSGATVPRSLETIVEDSLPLETFVKVQTDNIHKVMPHIPHKFCRVLNQDKPEYFLKHAKQNAKRGVPTMVFCNRTNTILFLKDLLQTAGIDSIVFHAQSSQKKREGQFQSFQNGESDILICTDIASRGLDTVRVQHVINYDFPQFMSDYIHRSGRVGRVGSHHTGFILNLISQKWDVDLLWQIEGSVRRTKELHNVNANIKRKLSSIIKDKYESNLNIV